MYLKLQNISHESRNLAALYQKVNGISIEYLHIDIPFSVNILKIIKKRTLTITLIWFHFIQLIRAYHFIPTLSIFVYRSYAQS